MGRKGWWSQLQSGDMPKTKTNYGDSSAANWRPERNRPSLRSNDKPIKLQKECPKCGRLYWVDKECFNCGYPNIKGKSSSNETDYATQIEKALSKSPKRLVKRYNISKYEWKLIHKYVEFYYSLESGSRIPKTKAQKRFVRVCKGLLKPLTIHEKAYLKYMKL